LRASSPSRAHAEHVLRRRVGPQRREAVHHEIDRIVANPFHRDFDDAGGLTVEQKVLAIFIGHHRWIVEQAELGFGKPPISQQEQLSELK
jgi:hypothetical protein